MKAKIAKWGNSLALRIPKSLAAAHSLSAGTDLEIVEMRDEFRVRPIIPNQYNLSSLLKEITPENTHQQQMQDAPRGKEFW